MSLNNKKPELLIPAGSLEVLKVAVDYGADAVYIGGEMFSLRAKAKNFSKEDMVQGIAYAHEHNVKVYITANITAHNADIELVREYFVELNEILPDAVIISDPGVFSIAKDTLCDKIDIHISTQANNVNYMTYKFWHSLGATRVVSGRELSLAEIKGIRDNIPDTLEIETFVHGAMCISYSGRCLLSNYMTGRDANKGACTHPCRWKYEVYEEKQPGEYIPIEEKRYAVVEENRPDEYFPIEENDRGTYVFNSKDLCMIEYIPELVAAGIDSFKIEGRMKTALYVAAVTRTYRKAIDDFFEDPELYKANYEWYKKEISKCTFRNFTTGFFFGKPGPDSLVYDNNVYCRNYIYLGIIEQVNEDNSFVITQRNKFFVGDTIEIMTTDFQNLEAKVIKMFNKDMEEVESCPHPLEKITILVDQPVKVGYLIRIEDKVAEKINE